MSSSFVIFLSLRDSLRCSVAIPFRFTDDNDKSSEISEIIFSRLSPSHCEQFAMVDDSPEHFFFVWSVLVCHVCVAEQKSSKYFILFGFFNSWDESEISRDGKENWRNLHSLSSSQVIFRAFVHVIQVHCCCGFVQDCPKTSRETTDIELLADQDYSRNRKK